MSKQSKTDVEVKEKEQLSLSKTNNSKSSSVVKNKKDDALDAATITKSKLLWTVSFSLIAIAILGNYFYANHYVVDESGLGKLVRVLLVIGVIVAGLGTALFTIKGKKVISFAREAYIELKKVSWPTRQEATQTTFIVFIAVSLVSLFLYLCDVIFMQIVKFITL